MSDDVGSFGNAISKSGMVENVRIAVGIAWPFFRSKVIFTSGFVADIIVLRIRDIAECQAVSALGIAISESGIVKHIGVAFGIASLSLSF